MNDKNITRKILIGESLKLKEGEYDDTDTPNPEDYEDEVPVSPRIRTDVDPDDDEDDTGYAADDDDFTIDEPADSNFPHPENLYWNSKGQYQKEYDQLWSKLVPAEGSAKTEGGELLRAFSRISYDRYNNGFGNGPHTDWWDVVSQHKDHIKDYLKDATHFDKFASAFKRTNYGERVIKGRSWIGDHYIDEIMDAIIEYVMSTPEGKAALEGNTSPEDIARKKWNAEADKYNQWDTLGQDEKDELIAAATKSESIKEGAWDYEGSYEDLYHIMNSRCGTAVAVQMGSLEHGKEGFMEVNPNAIEKLQETLRLVSPQVPGHEEVTQLINDYFAWKEGGGEEKFVQQDEE